MKSKTSIAAFLLAAVAAFPAVAQNNLYVGAGIGAAKARQVCANASNCDPDETAYKAFAGWQANKFLAVEGGFNYMGMFGRNSQGISATALDVLAVGSYPVLDQLSLYARAGAYFASMKSKPNGEDNIGFTYAIGAEYSLTKEFGVRVDWQRYDNVGGGNLGFKTDIDVLSAAVVWRPR